MDQVMLAYLGPGGALTLLGSAVALLAAIVLSLLGLVWYPARRLLRCRRAAVPGPDTQPRDDQPSHGPPLRDQPLRDQP